MRSLLKLILAVFAALLVATSAPALGAGHPSGAADPDAAAQNLTFGIGPARDVADGQFVDGRSYLNYVGTAGGTIRDQVAIFNLGTQPVTLQVYAADATQAEDGGFTLAPGDAKPAATGAWFQLDLPADRKVTVPARKGNEYGHVIVPIVAHIPADATPGDHVAGIVASLAATSTNTDGAQITLDQRVGLRAYFRLAGDLKPQLTVEHLQAEYTHRWDPLGRGTVTVRYSVRNTGNVRLSASQDLKVSRLFAGALKAHPPKIEDLLPGQEVEFTQTFRNAFGLGPMKATVTLHPTAVNATDVIEPHDTSRSVRFWAWPWLLLIEIVVVILLALGYLWWRRRRKRSAAGSPGAAGPDGAEAAPVASTVA